MALTTQSGAEQLKRYWWRFAYHAKDVSNAARGLEKVLVTAQTSKYRMFSLLPSSWVFDQKVVVFACEQMGFFAVMQSWCHVTWSDFFGSTMKDDPVYTPSDCFETYPFPIGYEEDRNLLNTGKAFYAERARLMADIQQGLTQTYNRFHDPHETSPEIKKLRDLHDDMDRAVLRAYGWDDLAEKATCDFLLDYEEVEDDDPAARKSKKKKPWRYRWPDEFRDEVLARLLELNEQRHQEELLAGAATDEAERNAKPIREKSKGKDARPKELF